MKTKIIKGFTVLFSVGLALTCSIAQAAVVITPVNNGSCLAVSPGPYTVMSNIVITEGAVNDLAIQTSKTLILTAPAGFAFNPGSGSVTFTAGMDISSASLSVTATTITVTFTVASNTKMDVLRIRNVGVRALSPNITGQILRTATGGTATITGDASGGGVNHGSLSASGTGAAISSVAAGNWSNPAIWSSGAVPACTDNVIINHMVTSDFSPTINDLTINTGGNLVSDNAIMVGGNFTMNGTGIYTHNNTSVASTTIFNGTESFAPTSKIIVNQWSAFATPLASGVNGNFGEIVINTTGTWQQDGMFAPARIKNTLTVNAGLLIMDNGNGMTTNLTVQDVVLAGSGRIQVQTGTPRNLTFTCGNFTDNSSSGSISSIVYQAVGNFTWVVNGNLTLNHRFSMIEGTSTSDVGAVNVQVNGNFTIGGGVFDGMKKVVGPFTMNVTGTTLITGNPSTVSFKNYYDGDLIFTSGTTTINAPITVYFMGTNGTVGATNVSITGDLNLTGSSTKLQLISNSSSPGAVALNVSNDLTMTDAQLYTAQSGGNVDVLIGRNYTQTGATSEFYGQRNTVNTEPTTLTVNGAASVSDGLFVQSRNLGTINMDIVEVFAVQNATFYGMNNTSTGNFGISSLSCSDLNISGSTFYLHRGYVTDGRTITVNIDNDLTIDFTSSLQEVMFINRGSDNTAVLDLNIGGNFLVYGSADGLFCSTIAAGNETIDIGGDMVINAGRVRFNAYENFTARGHVVTGNIGGSLIMGGGSLSLSSNRGNTDWTINGDYDQTAGYSIVKWYNSGYANLNILGNFNLSNGNMTLYSRAATAMSNPITVTINGNASLSNANLMFDSCSTSSASHKLIFKGSSVTYGSNVIFDHAAHLSTKTVFGNITYDRVGTITLRRNSSAFDIHQVKQYITSGTTVDFSSSPYDLMISSHALSTTSVHTTLYVSGNLNMGDKMIVARNQSGYYAEVDVNNGAKLLTAHTNGLYSGTAAPSCIYPLISGSLRMNYYLGITSRVVYNGVDNQRITGVGIGLATTDNHRYGYIEIDFNGTPDVEYVYITPSSDSATIRTGLILTKGELNLDSDHNPSGGGAQLHVLSGSTITRTGGYIRSETYDGSASLQWKIQTTGSFVVPFGYNSTSYIPLTFQVTAGNAGNTVFTTNRVASNNTPYPPTVTHVNNTVGVDNSANTVDRFWSLVVPGNVTANITFSFTASEATGIVSPRAQLWEPVSRGWFPPGPVQSNPTATTTQVSGVTNFNNWWALAPSGQPLPVELVSFQAKAEKVSVRLDWMTASEINNDHFTVERSLDGDHFTPVQQIPGFGTTSQAHNYVAYDESPRTGTNYYRLRQTDFDGKESFSSIRVVNFKKEADIRIYPNPVTGHFINISTDGNDEIITGVRVFDLAGKLVLEQMDQPGSANASSRIIDMNDFTGNGSYLVEVMTPGGVYRERLIKQ